MRVGPSNHSGFPGPTQFYLALFTWHHAQQCIVFPHIMVEQCGKCMNANHEVTDVSDKLVVALDGEFHILIRFNRMRHRNAKHRPVTAFKVHSGKTENR